MSRMEDISSGIWSDPDFEALPAPAAWLYIWSWTNPRCGMAGLYKISRRTMTESKVAADDIDAALADLATARFAFYEDRVIFIRTRVKRLRMKTPQIARAIARDVDRIAPSHPMRRAFLAEYSGSAWLAAELAHLTGTPGEPRATLTRGPGKSKGKAGRHGDPFPWAAWAAEHVPELPAAFAAVACESLQLSGADVTPDGVRARVRRRLPTLGGDTT